MRIYIILITHKNIYYIIWKTTSHTLLDSKLHCQKEDSKKYTTQLLKSSEHAPHPGVLHASGEGKGIFLHQPIWEMSSI